MHYLAPLQTAGLRRWALTLTVAAETWKSGPLHLQSRSLPERDCLDPQLDAPPMYVYVYIYIHTLFLYKIYVYTLIHVGVA